MMVMSLYQTTLWRYSFGIQPGRSSAGPRASTGPTLATGDSANFGARGRQSRTTGQQDSSTERSLMVMHWNAEGIKNKKTELQEFLLNNKIDILCVGETHLTDNQRFFVRGYELFRHDRKSRHKGGVLILVKNNIPAVEAHRSEDDDTEFLSVKLLLKDGELTVTNCYCPPNTALHLDKIPLDVCNHLVVGDFNSHSPSWGYPSLNSRGEEVEDWMLENKLILINQPHDPPTCFSRAWKTMSTPDLAMATGDIQKLTDRTVCKQLGGSDHLPVTLEITTKGTNETLRKEPSWNFKRANWTAYREKVDQLCENLVFTVNIHHNTSLLTDTILKAAKETIPRGRRKDYKAFWSLEVQKLHDDLTTAREKMEQNPTPENTENHNILKQQFNKVKNQEIQRSWHEKTSSLNLERDTTKLWKLAKSLNEDRPQVYAKTVIEDSGAFHTGKMAANVLADAFQNVSNLEMPKERIKEVEAATKDKLKEHPPQSCMTQEFTLQELNCAIRRLKMKKAPGKDGVTNEMIRHLGPQARLKLLALYNQSWQTGKVPNQWKEAVVVPILKKGKEKKDKANYRPISLLSCLGKTMERLVNSRLLKYLESNHLIDKSQTGFRRNRNTEDQLVYLTQEIENAFQEKKKVLAVFVDLSKAFDRVWKKGLLLKLAHSGISGRMFYWIRNFLSQRTARVKLGGKTSHLVKLHEGVPQGGVISPTLFLVFINDIMRGVPERISRALHADDLAAWHAAEYIATATTRMQETLDHIGNWAKDWGVEVNTGKTVSTCFSLSNKRESFRLCMNGRELLQEDTPTYLGITLDRRLTWNAHLQKAEGKAIKRLALMKKLAGTTWGANSRILKTVYTGSVRPAMDYGMSAWSTASKTNTSKLDRIQNTGLRIITGAIKTTPIKEMEKVTGLHSLTERKEEKVLCHREKLKRLPTHPAHLRISEPTKNRLKRQSFNHVSRQLGRQKEDIIRNLPADLEPLCDTEDMESCPIDIQISIAVPGIEKKGNLSPHQQKALTQEMLDREYNIAQWTHVYTDGSAEDAVRNGGSGIHIQYSNGRHASRSLPTGKLSTNYRAEQIALLEAAKLIAETDQTETHVVFLSDCKSVLENIQSPARDYTSRELQKALFSLSQKCIVALQWIPSHCEIKGNEEADKLSKEGSSMQQFQHRVSYPEAKTLIKRNFHQHWKQQRNVDKEDTSLQDLERWQQTIIFRLRTGHCRLLSHLHRLRVSHTNECPCGTGVQDPEHILQNCPAHTPVRIRLWPSGADLQRKLWGTTEDLKITSQFIRDINIPV